MKFYKEAIKLDEIFKFNIISSVQITIIKGIIKQPKLRNYFWKNLNHKEWFPILIKSGFFEILNQNKNIDNEIFLTQSYISDYLSNVAASYPKLIIQIIKTYSSNNYTVIWKFVEIGLKLDPVYTSKLVPEVKKWLDNPVSFSATFNPDLIKWLGHLLMGDQEKAALKLLNIIVSPKVLTPTIIRDKEVEKIIGKDRPKAIPVLEYYYMKDLFSEDFYRYFNKNLLEVSKILTSSLQKAIKIESSSYYMQESDYSYIWRVAIEDNPKNTELYELKEMLVVALRDCLEIFVLKDKANGAKIIQEFWNRKYSIFQRLAIHLLRINFDNYENFALKLAADNELLKSTDLYHEYYLFLADNFIKLPDSIQKSIIKSILNYDNSDPEARPEIRKKQRKYYHWEHLHFFKDYLDPVTRKLFTKLQTEFIHEKFRDTTSWTESYSGDKSPINKQTLADKGDKELWDYLKDYKGSKQRFNLPTEEGLARTFGEVIRINPERFIQQDLFPMLELKPNYSQVFITLISEQLKTDKYSILIKYIDKILSFCSILMRLENIPKYLTDDIGTNFVWVKKRILDIIAILLKEHQKEFSLTHKDKVWEIIEYLCHYELNPDDTPENYKDGLDPYSLAINSVRSTALITAIDYMLWYAFHTKKNYEGKKNPNRFIGEERVLELLEYKLNNKKNDPSLAIHSIFGVYLPNLAYLNYQWVIDNVNKIFSEENEIYWKTAWGGYINASRFYSDLFIKFKSQYEKAIFYLTKGEKMIPSGFGRSPEDALSEHLIVASLNGLDDITIKDSLLRKYALITQNPSAIHAVQFIANLAKDQKVFHYNIDLKREEFWPQAKEYWQLRIASVKKYSKKLNTTTETEDKYSTEFSRYFNWLNNLPEKVTLPVIQTLLGDTIKINRKGWHISDLISYLYAQSQKFPLEAVQLLNKLMKSDAPHHFYNGKEAEIKIILLNAIYTQQEEGYHYADMIANKFGEWGNYNFKDLWLEHLSKKKLA
jgi:hypothetical protein